MSHHGEKLGSSERQSRRLSRQALYPLVATFLCGILAFICCDVGSGDDLLIGLTVVFLIASLVCEFLLPDANHTDFDMDPDKYTPWKDSDE